MAVKNILVAFDGSEPSQSALAPRRQGRPAARCAPDRAADASHCRSMRDPTGAWLPVETMEMLIEREKESAEAVRRQFDARCAAEGMSERTSFFAVAGAGRYALCRVRADLRPGRHRPAARRFLGAAARAAPRQCRAVERPAGAGGAARPAGRGALENGAVLAWDGVRAAARALGDAMATLIDGGPLTVLHIGEDDAAGAPARPRRHGASQPPRHPRRAAGPAACRAARSPEILLEIAEVSGVGAAGHGRL